jgi:hypothetical protein
MALLNRQKYSQKAWCMLLEVHHRKVGRVDEGWKGQGEGRVQGRIGFFSEEHILVIFS